MTGLLVLLLVLHELLQQVQHQIIRVLRLSDVLAKALQSHTVRGGGEKENKCLTARSTLAVDSFWDCMKLPTMTEMAIFTSSSLT